MNETKNGLGSAALRLRTIAICLLAALALCVTIGSVVPLLPWLWVFVPTLTLLFIVFAMAALFARRNTKGAMLAGLVTLLLLGAGGVVLRWQSSLKWTALAKEDVVSIQRRVQVPLLEPISISSNVKYVRFSPALYDGIEASCGDDHCLSFGGLDRAYSWTEEIVGDAIVAAQLSVASSGTSVRINLEVEQQTVDGVARIHASLRDSKGEFATMRVSRPATDREWSPLLPDFLYLVLEHNVVARLLYPDRPQATKTPLADFLRTAIDVESAGHGVERRLRASVVRKLDIQPRRFSRGSPEAATATEFRPLDPSCAEQVDLWPPPSGSVLGYLALANSPVRIPFSAPAQVICRNEHIYVLTYGREWGMHTFQRYASDGAALGMYRVGAPADGELTGGNFWLVDLDSVQEEGSHLTYAVNGWRNEWVDPVGPNRREDIIHEQRVLLRIPLTVQNPKQ